MAKEDYVTQQQMTHMDMEIKLLDQWMSDIARMHQVLIGAALAARQPGPRLFDDSPVILKTDAPSITKATGHLQGGVPAMPPPCSAIGNEDVHASLDEGALVERALVDINEERAVVTIDEERASVNTVCRSKGYDPTMGALCTGWVCLDIHCTCEGYVHERPYGIGNNGRRIHIPLDQPRPSEYHISCPTQSSYHHRLCQLVQLCRCRALPLTQKLHGRHQP